MSIDRDGKKDFVVNEDTVKGKWKEIKGEVPLYVRIDVVLVLV